MLRIISGVYDMIVVILVWVSVWNLIEMYVDNWYNASSEVVTLSPKKYVAWWVLLCGGVRYLYLTGKLESHMSAREG